MRQVLTTTDLSSWLEAFQWQWNCVISLVGFLLAYPGADVWQSARDTLEAAIEVFEIFGATLADSASAANLIRGLCATIDRFSVLEVRGLQFATQGDQIGISHTHGTNTLHGDPLSTNPGLAEVGFGNLDDQTVEAMNGFLSGSMDSMFTVDSYNSYNLIWPDMDGFSMQ